MLRTIAARYGLKDVELFTTWLSGSGGPQLRQGVFGEGWSGRQSLPPELARLAETTRTTPEYQSMFGSDGDPFHLTMHLALYQGGVKPQRRKTKVVLGGEPVHYLLIGEQYRTLFDALREGLVPSETAERSSKVGVVCPPVGWLGNYRRSRDTGLWFRGQHRWHSLGNDGSS